MQPKPSRLLSLCAHICSIVVPFSLVAEESTVAVFEETATQQLKGLVLIDASSTPFESDALPGMEGLYILGLELPSELALLEELLAPLYFHQPFDEASLAKIKELVEEYFRKAGVAVVISLPDEPVQHGVLQLIVQRVPVESLSSEELIVASEELEEMCEEPVAEALVVEPTEPSQVVMANAEPEEMCEEPVAEALVVEPAEPEHAVVANAEPEEVCEEPVAEALVVEPTEPEHAVVANAEPEEVCEEPVAEALVVEPAESAHAVADQEPVNVKPLYNEVVASQEPEAVCEEPELPCPIGFEPVEEEAPPAPPVATMHHILVEDLKGLVLVDSEAELLQGEELDAIEGICVRGFDLPSRESLFEERLNPVYLHQPLYTEKIQEIKGAIYRYFQDCRDPFILLNVPSQKISSGVLQLVVMRAKLGEKRVEGNEYFPSQMLTRYVRTKTDEPIDIDRLQSDLSFINRNPFRRVNMIYAPGKETGTTDLILATEDTRPVRVYAGADNTGVFATNRQRMFTGATWGKVFGLDHVLSYQYTTSYDFTSFRGSTAQYIALLPWKHVFNVYGGYSTLHAELPFPAMTNEGKNGQVSGRYTIPWTASYISGGEFSIGFDFKSTNNTVEYSDLFINFANTVNLSQFVLEAKAAKEWSFGRTEFTVTGYWSPGAMLPNESDAQYNALRPGAKNSWVYGHFSLRHLQRLPYDFTFTMWLRGQMASANLLPSEQIGIGGHDTVRGYDERQLNMDAGLLFTAEARTPPISIISMIRKKPMKDALQFLGFVDYGYGRNHTKIVQEPNPDFLLSAGPGARYTLDPYIALRLDWGWKMHKQWLFAGGESMVHFSATLSY